MLLHRSNLMKKCVQQINVDVIHQTVKEVMLY